MRAPSGIGTCVVAAAASIKIVYHVATGAEEPELWILAFAAAMSVVVVATFWTRCAIG